MQEALNVQEEGVASRAVVNEIIAVE